MASSTTSPSPTSISDTDPDPTAEGPSGDRGSPSAAMPPTATKSQKRESTPVQTSPPATTEPGSSKQTLPEGAPPLPDEPLPGTADDNAPPLPKEPIPETEDDGWSYRWDAAAQSYLFYNRFTGREQFENPRVPTASTSTPAATTPAQGKPTEPPVAGGYNPAIHGDYDPTAWYAKTQDQEEEEDGQFTTDASGLPGVSATFNRFTGQFQTADQGPERHSDEAKARRQMNAFFDVDAAANSHDGRSLKAERSGKKLSKAELKHFKEKRRVKKEEKRRAWLRD